MPRKPSIVTDFSSAAAAAAHSVMYRYVAPVAKVPGTLIGATQEPDPRPLSQRIMHWNYWWQAHLMDAMVDAGMRHAREGDSEQAHVWFKHAQAMIAGIRARNMGKVATSFYDDMAWLALAVERMDSLSVQLKSSGSRIAQDAGTALMSQLRGGVASGLDFAGGGVSWAKQHRDFVNMPATAPSALAFGQAADHETAFALWQWANEHLWDSERSLYIDGVHAKNGGLEPERSIHSYNQGTGLAGLLYLDSLDSSFKDRLDFDPLQRAQELVVSIARSCSTPYERADGTVVRVISSEGRGDRGLFDAILVRHLAQAALYEPLDEDVRQLCSLLVRDSAQLLWEGRREFDPTLPMNEPHIDPTEIRNERVSIFSPEAIRPASEVLKPGAPVELSAQVGAWMIIEAAALLESEGR